ncbi:unnamed protein product, partial [Caretta caretta]
AVQKFCSYAVTKLHWCVWLPYCITNRSNLNRRCILRGGTCFYLRCPPFVRTLTGRCFSGGVCC